MPRNRWSLLACSALAVAQTAAASQDLSARELTAARKMYVGKCAKCHRFYEPKGYSESDWQRWMQSMSRKSKLKPEQENLLSRYLDAYRAGAVPDPTKRQALKP
jgi:cytochrome c553